MVRWLASPRTPKRSSSRWFPKFCANSRGLCGSRALRHQCGLTSPFACRCVCVRVSLRCLSDVLLPVVTPTYQHACKGIAKYVCNFRVALEPLLAYVRDCVPQHLPSDPLNCKSLLPLYVVLCSTWLKSRRASQWPSTASFCQLVSLCRFDTSVCLFSLVSCSYTL